MSEITLPLPPSVNALYRNRKKDGKGRGRIKTERYNTWLNAAGWELNQQKPPKVKGNYILWLYCERPDKRRRDLGNLLKAMEDLLTDLGVIEDDSLAVEIHLYWRGVGRSCRVRVESATPSRLARAA